jgi:hypothetical protein
MDNDSMQYAVGAVVWLIGMLIGSLIGCLVKIDALTNRKEP